ncbi:hypothetical protein C8F01DRAFT_1091569 [Mycena amicta]|nr:hypothetical protein C8F01DRAFT_1091569 [Mycena amicta]
MSTSPPGLCFNLICPPASRSPATTMRVKPCEMNIGDVRILPHRMPLSQGMLTTFVGLPVTNDNLSDSSRSYLSSVLDMWQTPGCEEGTANRPCVISRMETTESGDTQVYAFPLATFGGRPLSKITPEMRRNIIEVHQHSFKSAPDHFESTLHVHLLPGFQTESGNPQYMILEEYGPYRISKGEVLPLYSSRPLPEGACVPQPVVERLRTEATNRREKLTRNLRNNPAMVANIAHAYIKGIKASRAAAPSYTVAFLPLSLWFSKIQSVAQQPPKGTVNSNRQPSMQRCRVPAASRNIAAPQPLQ